MKFLVHGDSVVAMRFKYLAGELPRAELGENLDPGAESASKSIDGIPEELSSESLDFAVTELAAALANLPNKQVVPGQAYNGTARDAIDAFIQVLKGEEDLAVRNAYAYQVQQSLRATHGNLLEASTGSFLQRLGGHQTNHIKDIQTLWEAVKDAEPFSVETALKSFGDERFGLKEEVAQVSEHVGALASSRLEIAELAGDVTPQGLERDAELTDKDKRAPDKPVATFAARAEELPAVIAQAEKPVGEYLANLQAELNATTIGGDLSAVEALA